jgi:hypothetical protein
MIERERMKREMKPNKRVKTAEIKFYCEPELKEQIEAALGLVSLSAWMRDAARMKLDNVERNTIAQDILGSVLYPAEKGGH